MSAAPWTPGPWRQVWSTNGHFVIGIAGRDGVGVTDSRFNLWSGDDAEAKANARLIAAAPDLAEACQDAIDHIEALVDRDQAGHAAGALLATLRAALSKARGETA